MNFTIRPARVEDADSMAMMLQRIIDAGGFTILQGPITVEEQADFIRSFPAHGVFHTAIDIDTGSVVGIQDVMPLAQDAPALRHVGEISTFIELSLRGQGIGRRLCEKTFEAARKRGFRKLRATIRADNSRAIAFYHATGFETIGIAKAHAWVDGRYVDEVIAEKSLI